MPINSDTNIKDKVFVYEVNQLYEKKLESKDFVTILRAKSAEYNYKIHIFLLISSNEELVLANEITNEAAKFSLPINFLTINLKTNYVRANKLIDFVTYPFRSSQQKNSWQQIITAIEKLRKQSAYKEIRYENFIFYVSDILRNEAQQSIDQDNFKIPAELTTKVQQILEDDKANLTVGRLIFVTTFDRGISSHAKEQTDAFHSIVNSFMPSKKLSRAEIIIKIVKSIFPFLLAFTSSTANAINGGGFGVDIVGWIVIPILGDDAYDADDQEGTRIVFAIPSGVANLFIYLRSIIRTIEFIVGQVYKIKNGRNFKEKAIPAVSLLVQGGLSAVINLQVLEILMDTYPEGPLKEPLILTGYLTNCSMTVRTLNGVADLIVEKWFRKDYIEFATATRKEFLLEIFARFPKEVQDHLMKENFARLNSLAAGNVFYPSKTKSRILFPAALILDAAYTYAAYYKPSIAGGELLYDKFYERVYDIQAPEGNSFGKSIVSYTAMVLQLGTKFAFLFIAGLMSAILAIFGERNLPLKQSRAEKILHRTIEGVIVPVGLVSLTGAEMYIKNYSGVPVPEVYVFAVILAALVAGPINIKDTLDIVLAFLVFIWDQASSLVNTNRRQYKNNPDEFNVQIAHSISQKSNSAMCADYLRPLTKKEMLLTAQALTKDQEKIYFVTQSGKILGGRTQQYFTHRNKFHAMGNASPEQYATFWCEQSNQRVQPTASQYEEEAKKTKSEEFEMGKVNETTYLLAQV